MTGRQQQRGVTSIEYALLAALIGMVVATGVSLVGQTNGGIWANWTAAILEAIGWQ